MVLIKSEREGPAVKVLSELFRECAREKPPDPFRILKPEELKPLAPVAMAPVGRYAYKITWSDGHDTGIFTLEHLRALCECPECQNK